MGYKIGVGDGLRDVMWSTKGMLAFPFMTLSEKDTKASTLGFVASLLYSQANQEFIHAVYVCSIARM